MLRTIDVFEELTLKRNFVFTLKSQGGKLFRVKFNLTNNIIINLQITGDFFIYPENALEIIERELEGCDLDYEKIVKTFEETTQLNKISVIGFTAKDLANAIKGATEIR